MRFLLFAWMVFAVASIFFAKEALGVDTARISAAFSALPVPQRLAVGAIIFAALSLIGSAIWQARGLARQDKDLGLLRARLRGIRRDSAAAHGLQADFDAAAQTLVDSDPEEAIASLEKRLSDTEQKAVVQQGKNEAADLQSRLDDIRRRQQALREAIGEATEKRRAMEPVFSELRERQRLLDRSLAELEVDDHKNNLVDRLTEIDRDVSSIVERRNRLQEALATLTQFREELGKSQAGLAQLKAPESGINALIDDLRVRRDQLNRSLDEIESSDEEKLAPRVEALAKGKIEIQHRVARLDELFNILNSIRLDFEELGARRVQLETLLAEVETDSSGRSLADRQNELNAFVIASRVRLRTLQDSSAMLGQFKEDLAKSQAELVPLQAPVFGIEALIEEVHQGRDRITKLLDEIEAGRHERLDARVAAIANNKREIDGRMAQIFEHFTKLNSIRKDIGGIFATIRNTLNGIG